MPGLIPRRSTGTRTGDQRWIGSPHALSDAVTGTATVSKFTKNTHYPNGYLPSGTPVNVADPSAIGPWTAAAGQKLGFLKDNHQVVAETELGDESYTALQVAYLYHGRIVTSFLPGPAFTIPTGDAAGLFDFVGSNA